MSFLVDFGSQSDLSDDDSSIENCSTGYYQGTDSSAEQKQSRLGGRGRGQGGRDWRGRGQRGRGKNLSNDYDSKYKDEGSDDCSSVCSEGRGRGSRRGGRQGWRGRGGRGWGGKHRDSHQPRTSAENHNHRSSTAGRTKASANQQTKAQSAHSPNSETSQKRGENETEKSEQEQQRHTSSTPDYTPDELNTIFKYMLRRFNGRTKVGTLMAQRDNQFRALTHAQAAACFKRSGQFRTYEKDGQVKWVSIFCRGARLCFSYKLRRTRAHVCENDQCSFFHVCRDFVAGSCSRGSTCHFNHSFFTRNNFDLCEKFGLQEFSDEEIRLILFRSMFVVCDRFNKEGCSDDCPDIHVCSKFITKSCSDEQCKLGHQIRGTDHNNWVLSNFFAQKLTEGLLVKTVLVTGNESNTHSTKKVPPSDSDSTGPSPARTINERTVHPPEKNEGAKAKQAQKEVFTHRNQSSTKLAGQACARGNDFQETGDRRQMPLSTENNCQEPGDRRQMSLSTENDCQETGDRRQMSLSTGNDCKQALLPSSYDHLCELFTWRGDCSKKKSCPRFHHTARQPYMWQVQVFGEWKDVSDTDNSEIEECFCFWESHGLFEVVLDDIGGMQMSIDFNAMAAVITNGHCNISQTEYIKIRRWSTPSYVEADPDMPLSLYTQWIWYYLGEDGLFTAFAPAKLQYTMEKKYRSGQKKYYFEYDGKHYLLHLQKLKLERLAYDEDIIFPVQRRPFFALVDHGATSPLMSPDVLRTPPCCHLLHVPPHWCNLDHHQHFEMVDLERDTAEFRDVKRRFFSTVTRDRASIKHIYRIQNPSLWDKYCSTKRAMRQAQNSSNRDVDERKLFHGTPSEQAVRGICTNNMDFRRSGEHVGAVYGKGSYFSTTASYSHSYTRGPNRYMFLASVLVGQFTRGHQSYTKPPEREGYKLYDSCVNDVNNPSIFVIFDLAQSYPEYLIHYEDVEVVSPAPPVHHGTATQGARHYANVPSAYLLKSSPPPVRRSIPRQTTGSTASVRTLNVGTRPLPTNVLPAASYQSSSDQQYYNQRRSHNVNSFSFTDSTESVTLNHHRRSVPGNRVQSSDPLGHQRRSAEKPPQKSESGRCIIS